MKQVWIGVKIAATLAIAHPAIPLVLGSVAIAPVLMPAPALADTLTNWRFDPSNRQLELTIPGGTTPRYFLLAEPARIVVDLPNTDVGAVPEQQSFSGAVRQIRVGQFQPGLTRIVIELAPNAELAPEQVSLQQVGEGGDRWVLRPLLVGDAPIAAAPPTTSAPPPASAPEVTPSPDPTAEIPSVQPAPIAPPPAPAPNEPFLPAEPDLTAVQPAPEPAESPNPPTATETDLPPLEPGAMEIEVPPAIATVTPSPAPTPAPLPAQPSPSPQPAPAEPSPAPSESLPPAILLGDRPVTVSVPPLDEAAIATASPAQPLSPPAAIAPSPTTAPLPPSFATGVPGSGSGAGVLEFGEPLPGTAPFLPEAEPAADSLVVAATPDILLPEGTVLSLRYPREVALQLEAGEPRQEVLVLSQAVRDRTGVTLLPEGSQIIGQFETTRRGSRFIARALSLSTGNIPIEGRSDRIRSERQVESDDLLRNSAIGGVALAILSGFTGIGLLGGLAAGAATTFVTAPQPAIIEPNQIVEVRITEDVRRPF